MSPRIASRLASLLVLSSCALLGQLAACGGAGPNTGGGGGSGGGAGGGAGGGSGGSSAGGLQISGFVDGDVAAGVTMALSGTKSATLTTDSSGYYAFTGLSAGRYQVEASLPGYDFHPGALALELDGDSATHQDFESSTASYGISVSATGLAGSAWTISITGAESFGATTTDSTYVFNDVPVGNYVVTATAASGLMMSPSSVTVTVVAGTSGNFFAPRFTVVSGCSADGWCPVTGLPAMSALAIWGSAPDDLWLVGGEEGDSDSGHCQTAHWNGTAWATVNCAGAGVMTAVWGSSPSSVVAVGEQDTTFVWNGSTWSGTSAVDHSTYNGVGGVAGDFWAAGTQTRYPSGSQQAHDGIVAHWNGTAWDYGECQGYRDMRYGGAWPIGNGGGWILKNADSLDEGRIGRSDTCGPDWYAPASLNGIWGSSTRDIWAVGNVGTMVHYNGSAWSVFNGPVSTRLNQVWGTSAADVWAAGEGGVLLHYNGTDWIQQKSGTTDAIVGGVSTGAHDTWVLTGAGALLRRHH